MKKTETIILRGGIMEQYYEKWKKLKIKKVLVGIEALEAVKNDGDALRYVKEEIFIKIEIVETKK